MAATWRAWVAAASAGGSIGDGGCAALTARRSAAARTGRIRRILVARLAGAAAIHGLRSEHGIRDMPVHPSPARRIGDPQRAVRSGHAQQMRRQRSPSVRPRWRRASCADARPVRPTAWRPRRNGVADRRECRPTWRPVPGSAERRDGRRRIARRTPGRVTAAERRGAGSAASAAMPAPPPSSTASAIASASRGRAAIGARLSAGGSRGLSPRSMAATRFSRPRQLSNATPARCAPTITSSRIASALWMSNDSRPAS